MSIHSMVRASIHRGERTIDMKMANFDNERGIQLIHSAMTGLILFPIDLFLISTGLHDLAQFAVSNVSFVEYRRADGLVPTHRLWLGIYRMPPFIHAA